MSLAILAKILGMLDLGVAIYISLLFFDRIGAGSVLWILMYFGIKWFAFRFDVNTWIEVGIGVFVLLLMIGVHLKWMYVFSLVYMGQKGLMSLM